MLCKESSFTKEGSPRAKRAMAECDVVCGLWTLRLLRAVLFLLRLDAADAGLVDAAETGRDVTDLANNSNEEIIQASVGMTALTCVS